MANNLAAPFYCYKAYGLNIASCLECPDLLTATGPAEVTIHYGHIPQHLPNIQGQGVCYEATQGELLLDVPEIGRYWVRGGNRITIEPDPQVRDNDLRLFLLGSALGALLHQRGLLVLHGSAIVVAGEAVLFLGPSGVGKSTLAAAFQRRGYRMATDDICAIAITNNGIQLNPGFPQVKLWADACTKLGEEPQQFPRIRPELEKYALPPKYGFWPEPLPLKQLYVLTTTNQRELRLEPLQGTQKFMTLGEQTYRVRYMKGMGYASDHLRGCGAVAKQVPVMKVIRPRGWFLLDELVEMIEADFAPVALPLGVS